jgi:hypothetical protein
LVKFSANTSLAPLVFPKETKGWVPIPGLTNTSLPPIFAKETKGLGFSSIQRSRTAEKISWPAAESTLISLAAARLLFQGV